MRAVSSRYGAGRAAVLALGAGADLVLYATAGQVPGDGTEGLGHLDVVVAMNLRSRA